MELRNRGFGLASARCHRAHIPRPCGLSFDASMATSTKIQQLPTLEELLDDFARIFGSVLARDLAPLS